MTKLWQSTAALTLTFVGGCATTAPPAASPSSTPVERPAVSAPAPPPPGELLATVGGRHITTEEFQREMARRGGREPGQFSSVEQRQALLDEMIRDRAVVAAAEAAGLADDPEFRATMDRMLAAQYLRSTLDPKIQEIDATPEEIAAFYESHRDEFLTPERVRAAWVFIPVPAKSSPEAIEKSRSRAEEALAAARKLPADTAHLGSVAREFSEDPATRYTGGELGWLYLDQAETYRLGPEVVRGAFALAAPGEMTPVLRHEKGFYFLKLVKREESVPTPIEKLRGGIRSRILTEKREAARQEFYRALLAGVPVKVDQAKLSAIAPLSPKAPAGSPPPPLPVN